MRKYKRHKRKCNGEPSVYDNYLQPVLTEPLNGYEIRNGFLDKNGIPLCLVSSEIVQSASEGFILDEEPEHYKTTK